MSEFKSEKEQAEDLKQNAAAEAEKLKKEELKNLKKTLKEDINEDYDHDIEHIDEEDHKAEEKLIKKNEEKRVKVEVEQRRKEEKKQEDLEKEKRKKTEDLEREKRKKIDEIRLKRAAEGRDDHDDAEIDPDVEELEEAAKNALNLPQERDDDEEEEYIEEVVKPTILPVQTDNKKTHKEEEKPSVSPVPRKEEVREADSIIPNKKALPSHATPLLPQNQRTK